MLRNSYVIARNSGITASGYGKQSQVLYLLNDTELVSYLDSVTLSAILDGVILTKYAPSPVSNLTHQFGGRGCSDHSREIGRDERHSRLDVLVNPEFLPVQLQRQIAGLH